MIDQTSSGKDYQILLAPKLQALLGLDVLTEWRAMKEQKSLYCPRVDIAVGPFVYDEKCIPEKHDPLIIKWEKPLKAMLDFHKKNVEGLSWENCSTSLDELCHTNKTARCFMAIEIENNVTRKHMIGSALNAMALGRLGIVVACTDDKLRAFIRLRRYLWFLSNATNISTNNLLVLDRDQFAQSFGFK